MNRLESAAAVFWGQKPGAMNVGHTKRTHALVMGGSVAGLLAARALADHFEP